MRGNLVEVIAGALVLLIAGFILFFAYKENHGQEISGYKVTAKFDRADGLVVGSDIKLGGIKIGKVTSLEIDPKIYMAIATLSIVNNVKLPIDSTAAIVSESLLGGKYLSISPGGEEDMLKDGDEIYNAQSALILESLISQLIFSNKEKEEKA
jgi:phospholipid/cholesterol/gamma-HCH transport system substrate-binding protein